MVVISQDREGTRGVCEDARSESGYAEDLQVVCELGGIRNTVLQGCKGCAGNLSYFGEGIVGDVGNKCAENSN